MVTQTYNDIFNFPEDNKKEIDWNKWEYITIEKDTAKKRVVSCVAKKTEVKEFFDELAKDLEPMAMHICRAEWQHQQLKTCIETLSQNEVCLIMDYAQDYMCRFKNETQTAFFEQNQVTFHPMMAYYSTKVEGKEMKMKHSIIGVTDDSKKDACRVKVFEERAISIIQENKNEQLMQVNEFTDGCAAQYKGEMRSMIYL